MSKTWFREKKSPLKREPLRNPGESLSQQISDRIDRGYDYAFWLMIMVAVALFEWWRWYFNPTPHPVPVTLVAALVGGYCVFRLVRLRSQLRMLRLGRDGEKAVGEVLDTLRAKGWRVFHDVPGNGFNIDHVVISPHGIFAIETKTRSKPAYGPAKIEFDGHRIRVNGMEPERDPVKQVLANKDWLSDLLQDMTGQRFPVKGVVLFPGWWVAPDPKPHGSVWVLNPEMLSVQIQQEPKVIKDKDIALAASRLTVHVTR